MSTEDGIRIGLMAAATHLEDEAEACEKKAEHLKNVPGGVPGTRAALLEHANLLRKQASEIRSLRVTRGR